MSNNPLTGGFVWEGRVFFEGEDIFGVSVLFSAMTKIITLNLSNCGLGLTTMPELAKLVRDASATIERVNVCGCQSADQGGNVTQEVAAQLLTAANEASRARLRAHQSLAFGEGLHARLGSKCLLQAVAIDADVWRRVAEIVRERRGHEPICARLAKAGQTLFEVTVEGLIAEGLIAEGIPR